MFQRLKGNGYVGVIVVLSFLMIFTGLGFVSSTRSLFTVPITEELGIERSLYSFVDSIRFVVTAVVNLFFGVLVARFGARRLIGVGFFSLIAAVLLCCFSHHLLLFYLAGALLGIGFTFTATTMVGYVINCWRPARHGTVMGAVLAANGLGGALATQIVSPMINGAAGWRAAYLVIASVLLFAGGVTVIFFRDRAPEPKETAPSPEATLPEETPRDGRGRLLLLAAAVFFTGFVLQGITGVAAPHMRDVGISPEWVATALSVHMATLTCSKFLTGFLYDKCGLRTVVCIDVGGAILVTVLLALMNDGPLGIPLALAYGVLSALALPLETVMLPIYAREFFGEGRFARMLGILVSVNTAGYALGGPCLNLIFDLTGSYYYGFLGCTVLTVAVLAILLILTAGRACPE